MALIYGQLVRAQLENSASDLTPVATGLVYYNTTTGPKWYNGSAWLTAADLTSTQTLTGKTIDGNNNTLTVLAASQLSGAVPIANGGTGQTSQTAGFDALSPTTTKGDIIAHDGADNIRFAVGADGTVLTANSAQPSGLSWTAPLTNPMDSAGDLIVGGVGGVATKLDSGTSGQLLLSNGAASPSWTDTITTAKTFSAKVGISDGSVSAPSIGFTSDDDGSGTGIYRIGANSMGFSANGTEVGRYSSAGAWRFGPAAGLSGTFQSTANVMLVGGDDLNASGNFLTIGRRSSGTKVAYLAAGAGLECGLEFSARDSGNAYLNVGGYDSAGAWTFGNGTGQIHRFNCQTNAAAPGAVSTYMRINVNGTTYKVALLGNT